MAKVYIGATIDPDLYNSLRKKFAKLTDTAMVSNALTLLLEGENLSKEEREFISLLREKTGQAKENVLEILKGERHTYKYIFNKNDLDKVNDKFQRTKSTFEDFSTLISLLLWFWATDRINIIKTEDGWNIAK